MADAEESSEPHKGPAKRRKIIHPLIIEPRYFLPAGASAGCDFFFIRVPKPPVLRLVPAE